MYLFTKFLLFILIWWIIFFITLPIKISVPKVQEEGHANSAPKKTYIAIKIFLTTLISVLIMILLIIINFDLGIIFKQ